VFRTWPFTNALLLISILSIWLFCGAVLYPAVAATSHDVVTVAGRSGPAPASAGNGGAHADRRTPVRDRIGPRWLAVTAAIGMILALFLPSGSRTVSTADRNTEALAG
jgi:hypothetical protein